jgi:hypothetical protein
LSIIQNDCIEREIEREKRCYRNSFATDLDKAAAPGRQQGAVLGAAKDLVLVKVGVVADAASDGAQEEAEAGVRVVTNPALAPAVTAYAQNAVRKSPMWLASAASTRSAPSVGRR